MGNTFKDLPRKQYNIFCEIAIENGYGHHPDCVKALLQQNYIAEKDNVSGKSTIFPLNGGIYSIPQEIFFEWTAWCAEKTKELRAQFSMGIICEA